jgi:tetratricopeptide (TPR) repeat protein
MSAQIARWIEELGDDSFAIREQATKKLRAAGAFAEAMLEKATASKDPEVVRRAKSILADFKWGIYPDTPEKVVELIRSYRSSARSEKRAVIEKLFAAGTPGCRVLLKITRAEEDPLVRKDVFSDLAASLIRGVPVLLEEGNLAALEGLLQLALEGDVKTGVGHYTAYHLLTGALPRRIKELEIRAKKNPPGKVESEILAYLYRARGDLARAAKAAVNAEVNELLEGILYESADWKELVRQPDLTDTRLWTRYVGSRTAYARLAGNLKSYEIALKDVLDRARPIADNKGNVLPYAKVLFLNARPAEAIELLKKSGSRLRLRFEVLAAQLNLKDAFAVVEEARLAKSPELPALEIASGRLLYQCGEKDKGLALLERYAKQIKPGLDASWLVDLVEAEVQIGRREDAFAHAVKVLTFSEGAGWPVSRSGWLARMIGKLFPEQEEEAAGLWRLFRRTNPKQPAEKALARVRLFLEGKANAREGEMLVSEAGKEVPGVTPDLRQQGWFAAGEALLRCKQHKRAAECFAKGGGIRALIRWGDALAAKKEWAAAAERYLEAYKLGMKGLNPKEESDREDSSSLPVLALYLHGHAQVKAGKAEAGSKRIEQSHLLPLGSGEVRYHFAKALMRRGHRQGATREHELLRRLGSPILADPDSFFTGEGLRAGAIEAAARKDLLKAADGYEQAFLRCLHPDLNFARYTAYVTVPGHIHRTRAEGLARAGRFDEAKIEASRANKALPGNVDLAIALVPILEQSRRTKDAGELFAATFALYEGLLREYPRHAWAYNQAAWLSACCKRKLDVGLTFARKAVTLAPKMAGYHDTLAEVLFQLGKKDEAIAAQKKAIELEPKRAYFQKQLKRIEAGDPKAPRPQEED